MEKLLNGDVDCPGVIGQCCLTSEAIKGLKYGKRSCTNWCSEFDDGGFGTRWITDLLNNIVK